MKLKALISICFLIFVLQGCALLPGYEPLANLENLGGNRARMGKHLKQKERLYKKLEADLKDGRLKEGAGRQEIISYYGEPVFFRAKEGGPAAGEVLIYRHPTEYFSSDMIYLYLDNKDSLASWEIKPAPLSEQEKESPR
ncbi:MAG: hypothetical protein V1925_03895 [Candidatus Omnitrophota bacterium]